MELKLKVKYKNLPDSSVLKQKNSIVSTRVNMSRDEVVNTLYNLKVVNIKDIKSVLHTPVNLSVPGIYCFLRKIFSLCRIIRKHENKI